MRTQSFQMFRTFKLKTQTLAERRERLNLQGVGRHFPANSTIQLAFWTNSRGKNGLTSIFFILFFCLDENFRVGTFHISPQNVKLVVLFGCSFFLLGLKMFVLSLSRHFQHQRRQNVNVSGFFWHPVGILGLFPSLPYQEGLRCFWNHSLVLIGKWMKSNEV